MEATSREADKRALGVEDGELTMIPSTIPAALNGNANPTVANGCYPPIAILAQFEEHAIDFIKHAVQRIVVGLCRGSEYRAPSKSRDHSSSL